MDRARAKRSRVTVLIGAVLVAGSLLTVTPAGAQAPEVGAVQPDAILLKPNGTSVAGRNIYNETGLNQTLVRGGTPGTTVNTLFRIQNDSDSTKSLTPQGCSGNTFFRVRYFLRQSPGPDIDITSSITGGVLSIGRNPGQTETYRVEVKVKSSAPVGATYDCLLSVRIARKGPDPTDVAKLTVRAT